MRIAAQVYEKAFFTLTYKHVLNRVEPELLKYLFSTNGCFPSIK